MTGLRSLAKLGGVRGRLRRDTELAHDMPTAPESDIDTDWLERRVFFMAPEVVGAAYHRRVAGAEVAAVLARMCGELKLASRVATGARGWNNLELWLLAEREELADYERELVDSLFITGKTTSADIIQREYRSAGFEPAAILRPHLSAAADAALGVRRRWPFGLRRESADGLALRRDLLSARRFFARELARPEPRLRDEWLPYLIALELSGEVERWFQAFGRIETAALEQRLAQQAESNEGAARGWTGGAGGLGGTGASGPWIAAAAGLTVAAAREKRASAGKRAPRLQLEHA